MNEILDNVVWASLTGPQAGFAERHGAAARYPSDVAVFGAVADPDDPASWRDLAELVGPGGGVSMAGNIEPPSGWEVAFRIEGVQMVGSGMRSLPEPEAVRLGPADAPEMLALVERTQPGPFAARTVALRGYLGIRRDDALVAMAGRRMHAPGWVEISAVCTDDAHRGQGLGSRLVRAVAHAVRAGGDEVFLHAAASNTGAIRLYEAMGFTTRMPTSFWRLNAPAASGRGRLTS